MSAFVSTATPRPGWSAVITGQPQALEWLCAEWLPTTLQWCRRLGGPRVDADQAAQEVFIVVLRKVHTVKDEASFPSWLMAVTRRVLAQQRRLAWPNRWDPDVPLEGISTRPDPSRRLDAVQLIQIIDELPDGLREAFVLCDVEQRTDEESAALLGIPVGTLKGRLRRARRRVRTRARNHGLLPGEEST